MQSMKTVCALLLLSCLPFMAWAQQDEVNDLIRLAQEEQASSNSSGESLARWLQVFNKIKEEKQHPQFSNTCIAIADIYHREELYTKSLPYYLQASESLAKHQQFDEEIETVYSKIANIYAQLPKLDSMRFYYQKILLQKEKTSNVNGQINVLQALARAYAQNDQHLDALDYYIRIKNLLESNGHSSQELLKINNNLGYTYNHLKRFEEAISHFETALTLLDENDFSSSSDLSVNIGVAYFNLGKFNTSIDYFLEARKLKAKNQPKALDQIDQLIATVFLKKQDLHNALEYAESAEAIAVNNNNKLLLVDIYYTSALIYADLYEYDDALEHFQQHLRLRDSFALEEKFRQQELLQQHIDLERTEKQIKLFLINEEVKELTIAQLQTEAENRRLDLEKKEAQLATEQKEKEILQKDNELQASKLRVQASETQRARQELELTRQRLRVSQQEKENVALQQEKTLQALELKNKEAQLEVEQKEKSLLVQEKEISVLALEKQKERTRFLYGLGGLLALILLLVGGGLVYYRKLNQELNRKNQSIEKQKKEISEERKKSDNLLLNILPEQIASELKNTGKATTKKHENVTILFTDFKDFTKLVASIPSSLLVSELNDIFSRFDDIMETHAIEKIETIGDAYLAACGLPEENTEHAIRCVNAAFEMLNYLHERNKTHQVLWNMRVGIHSGPVVAGVVGKKKFAYDLFGDAVNTASRIETNGEAGKVNISHTTYELIKNAPGLSFEHRGEIHAKGKGLLTMWFVGR